MGTHAQSNMPPESPSVRQTKCCGKCAFKKGSQETEDGYLWIGLAEAWREGAPFYCHESVPGHYQEVADDRPRWRTCAGWEAHKKTHFQNAMKPIGINENAERVYLPEEEFALMTFEMTHCVFGTIERFSETDAPDWLTGVKTSPGSTMDRSWFWKRHVLTLKPGASVETDFRTITRVQ